MKKLVAFCLVIALIAVPVFAAQNLICDMSGYLTEEEVAQLETLYVEYQSQHGFTPVFLATDNFDGMESWEYAETFYDSNGYPQNGVLLLVSMQEGIFYILTRGDCEEKISLDALAVMYEELLWSLAEEDYYNSAVRFLEMVVQARAGIMPSVSEPVATEDTSQIEQTVVEEEAPVDKPVGKTVAISMAIGLLIGAVAVGIMAIPMKSVNRKTMASDYVRPGSMMVTDKRDIYLYSRTRRMAKSKSSNPSASRSKSAAGGNQRGGAGGKL